MSGTRRTLGGYRLTDAADEYCRRHVPQDELLVAAKRLGFTVLVAGDVLAATHTLTGSQRSVAGSPAPPHGAPQRTRAQ